MGSGHWACKICRNRLQKGPGGSIFPQFMPRLVTRYVQACAQREKHGGKEGFPNKGGVNNFFEGEFTSLGDM